MTRDVLPDSIYNSKIVTKLINQIMQDGKKEPLKKFFMKHLILLQRKLVNLRLMFTKKLLKILSLLWKLNLVELVEVIIKCQLKLVMKEVKL